MAQALAVVLILRVASAARPGLGADLVHAGQAVQEPPQRRVVAGDVQQLRALDDGHAASLGADWAVAVRS